MSLKQQAFEAISKQRAHQQAIEGAIGNQRAHQSLNAYVGHVKEYEKVNANRAKQGGKRRALKFPLSGRLIAVKDNICTIGKPTTCASAILRNYQSPYAATVVQNLEAVGALIHGKTNLDEFGMGSHSIYSIHGRVRSHLGNHEDPLSVGGSSGGSALAVATNQCWAALGTDTGGSVRLPAAYTGVVGFKPSYGIVSRWGVVAYANSLDTVGVLAHSTKVAREVFNVIRGYDSNDPTSLRNNIHFKRFKLEREPASRPLRIGVPREYNIKELDPVIRQAWLQTLIRLQEDNYVIQKVSLPTTQAALSAYYIIAPAEASSNLAKYDGIRFGSKSPNRHVTDNLYALTRGNGLGEEVRRRILLGSYSLSAAAIDNYFIKAQKVRRLVQQDFNRVFTERHPLLESEEAFDDTKGVDVIISPTAPSLPPTHSSLANAASVNTYSDDVFTVPASLAGLPAISVPVPIEVDDPNCAVKTTGLQVIGQYGDDKVVLDVAESIQKLYEAPAT